MYAIRLLVSVLALTCSLTSLPTRTLAQASAVPPEVEEGPQTPPAAPPAEAEPPAPTAPAAEAPPATPAAAPHQTATLQLVVFGAGNRGFGGVVVEGAGVTATTAASGAASMTVSPGTHVIRLRVPREHVPKVPSNDPLWVVDLRDVAAVDAATTYVTVGLSEVGAISTLDIQAPEAAGGGRNLEREYQKALAEKPRGFVRGTVSAADTKELLEGARVYVRGAPVDALTNSRGEFVLELPEGSYQLSVIHPAYSTQSLPSVRVNGGQSNSQRAELSPATSSDDEFVITARHIEGGIASLIEERRETSAVADVIGSEQMARSGDSNAASALSRVTGLTVVDGRYIIVRGMGERYSSLTLNRLQVPSPEPTRRIVPLDIFPTGVLESVVVQKSFSPDMPGEFGGGVVQLRTRKYPDDLLLSVTFTGGINTEATFHQRSTYAGGKWDALGVDDGTRALPSTIASTNEKIVEGDRLGGFTPQELQQYGESLPNKYATHKRVVPPNGAVTLTVGDKYKLRVADLGFVASVGYKNEFRSLVESPQRTVNPGLNGARDTPQDDYRMNSLENLISLTGFLDWGVEFSKDQTIRFTTMLLRQTEDSTFYRTGFNDDATADQRRTRLLWIERQVLTQQVAGLHRFKKARDFQVDWRYAYSRAERSEPDRRDYLYEFNGAANAYLLENSTGDTYRLYGTLQDDTHEGAIDLTQPFKIWKGLPAKLKIGGLIYDRKRDADVRRFAYDISRTNSEQRALAPEQLFAPDNLGSGVQFLETTETNDAYASGMKLQSGYAMTELSLLEQVELMAGARVEHAFINADTFTPFSTDNSKQRARLDNVDWLPAATLTWKLHPDVQLRGGYSRTLNRPDLRELSPSRYQDLATNQTIAGNRDLQRAIIDNYDLRLEYYFASDEVFSVGGFMKSFTDPIESTIVASASETVFTFVNSDSAKLMGLELEGRKRFSFISEALDAMYLASNLSLIKSEVEVEGRKRPLQAQSPWVVNVQLGWDNTEEGGTGTAASIVYNVFGRRLRSVGDYNANVPDMYEEPVNRLDLVASQDLGHGFKLGAKAQNILNPVQIWTQGDVEVRRYKRGAEFMLSLAWTN